MCYHPIHIYNPVRTYNNDQPLRVAVPCNNCEDCQRIKKNEWFFRSYIEYKHYKKIGGSVYFVTLTYSNENLPFITLPDGTNVPCFNKYHVRNFVKYIRVWLERNHMMSKGIKFLICSEYGKNTKRPHYHGLLFFPFHINALSFTRLMRTWWQHGFVICSKQGWEINSVAGISYASKYVAKDFTYFNLPSLKKIREFGDFKQFCRDNKDFLPRHWQSVGYGESFCNIIMSQTDIPSFLAKNSVSLWNDSSGTFPIPRYYHLKIEKSINKDYSILLDKVVLERTDIGTKVKSIRLHESVIKDMSNLSDITPQKILISVPPESVWLSRFDFLRTNMAHRLNYFENLFHKVVNRYPSYDSMRETFKVLIPQMYSMIDKYKLSLYRCFLRYMPISEDEVPEHKFCEVSDIIKNMLYPSVYPPEYADIIVPSGLSEFAHPLANDDVLKHQSICKYNPYFKVYESLCTLFDDFNCVASISKEFNTLYNNYMNSKCKHYEGSKPSIYKSFNQK